MYCTEQSYSTLLKVIIQLHTRCTQDYFTDYTISYEKECFFALYIFHLDCVVYIGGMSPIQNRGGAVWRISPTRQHT